MSQKTALITGASQGIGAAAARAFAEAGYAVALHYHQSEQEALALAAELSAAGHSAAAFQADMADPAQVDDLVDKVLGFFCRIDTLVCNAGCSLSKLLGDMTTEEWRRLLAVNLDGVFYCCRAVYPHFVRRKAGRIITVSSVWGLTGAACETAYSASKAGVIGLTKALAKELGPSGITVNCVAPGVISTRMNEGLDADALEALRAETPLETLGTPEDVAGSILFLASDAASFITGQVLSPNGGLVI
ncbi:MAG: SDR family oxidoreductase [Clostridiales bacterium]|nr:SDR family oxidoreductase [Clostridiales bacterium]